ncbi:Protein canopy 4 [Acropora cervicornis]|uniref:Protein canopy 4 n=1 Tax=Acropora cervicornis TaxID=6130 RepID=A0AAD9VDR6_ACRCE|nr:Protein canopy 4 [Acropora cervicornis]
MLLRRCLLYLVLLISIAVCTELVFDEEFVVIDGIRVRADSIKNETNNFDDKNKREKESGKKGKDDIIEEQTDDDGSHDDDDGEESDNEDDDDLETTKHLPTKCHVCRLLAVEIENKLTTVGRIRKTRENGNPIYFKEEIVILRVTEDLCNKMTKYNIRSKHPFRYKRGVKSRYRQQIEELTKNSRIQKWMFATPEEDIDDPTGEIRRLKQKCHDMLVQTQPSLIHWFMKAQSRDLTKWLCAKRVLRDDNQDCLKVEMPKSNLVPALRPKKPAPQSHDDKNTGTRHEEL